MSIITVTVTGTISPYILNVNTPGHFPYAPTPLSGDPFTVIWQFDYFGIFPDGNATRIPDLVGILTINGQTHTTAGVVSDFPATISNYNNSSTQSFLQIFSHQGLDTFVITNTAAIPSNLQPFTYTFNPLTDNMQWDHQIGGAFALDGLSGLFAIETIALENSAVLPVPGPVMGADLPSLLIATLIIGFGVFWKNRPA